MPEPRPYVLVELLFAPGFDPDDLSLDQVGVRCGIETADEQAATLAAGLMVVLAGDGIGPEWAPVLEAIRAIPDEVPDA